jgi:hypothetical protein
MTTRNTKDQRTKDVASLRAVNQNGRRSGQGDRLLHPDLPTATARAVTEFVPADGGSEGPVAVELVDYGIVTVIQVTSLSPTLLTVTDMIVNGDFHPGIAIGSLKALFVVLLLPRQMTYGASFHAVVQGPATIAKGQPWCCCPKQPTAITVSTSLGDFSFAMGEMFLQNQ